ncbi:MAG: hypothetical protein ACLQIK_26745 [Mycobacterium sp.]|uniref:hypothetical protein n=1 Tax=Mycobacterium sp. TaxID=1785 RepID=UPI003F954F14
MTKPIPPTVKPKPPSQRPRPEGPAISRTVTEACAIALWEVPPNRIRELAGLPELSNELIQHRIDMLLKAGVPWLFEDGARKLRKRK